MARFSSMGRLSTFFITLKRKQQGDIRRAENPATHLKSSIIPAGRGAETFGGERVIRLGAKERNKVIRLREIREEEEQSSVGGELSSPPPLPTKKR
ncbi:hypothetical protein ACLOJK_005442 [Asimina triloba]